MRPVLGKRAISSDPAAVIADVATDPNTMMVLEKAGADELYASPHH
jgi:hypothetical protein